MPKCMLPSEICILFALVFAGQLKSLCRNYLAAGNLFPPFLVIQGFHRTAHVASGMHLIPCKDKIGKNIAYKAKLQVLALIFTISISLGKSFSSRASMFFMKTVFLIVGCRKNESLLQIRKLFKCTNYILAIYFTADLHIYVKSHVHT